MPILKNQKVGKHENVTVIRFGFGDVEVSSGYCGDDDSIAVVAFGQGIEKPVEEYTNEIPVEGNNADGLVDPVLLRFSRIESIDIVMDRLQRAKEYLIDKDPGYYHKIKE